MREKEEVTMRIIRDAWCYASMMSVVENAWEVAGIEPFNPKKILDGPQVTKDQNWDERDFAPLARVDTPDMRCDMHRGTKIIPQPSIRKVMFPFLSPPLE